MLALGGQNHHWHSDNPFHRPMFWRHRRFQEQAIALWEAIASRYSGRPEVAGYNVLAADGGPYPGETAGR